ncbi:MAG TPA: hypothetical protein DDZ81_19265 [Acetobacteraceae bacterium]|jgi:DNA-binding response OmpR family regulator|nr:hypothetical protein [Acetobacteraceae bacterium]
MSTPPTIIISEPDPMISGVLRVEFSRWDFAVLLAGNSAEAEEYASQTVASLVVLDACVAGSRAYEACARIRRRRGYDGRPIVITANEVSARTRAAAEKAGATVLLPKPYSMMDLFRAVTPHVAANDPLLMTATMRQGVADARAQEWKTGPTPEWRAGGESALSRNGLLLPIVRGRGVKMPLVHGGGR